MGLAEKRAVEQFKTNIYPKLKSEIDEAAGFDVNIDVEWDTLAEDEYAHLYNEGFEKVYFSPLIKAFKDITIDDLGKKALKAGLSQVAIKNASGIGSTAGITFDKSVLTIDHSPVTNIDDVDERASYIQKIVEKAL